MANIYGLSILEQHLILIQTDFASCPKIYACRLRTSLFRIVMLTLHPST